MGKNFEVGKYYCIKDYGTYVYGKDGLFHRFWPSEFAEGDYGYIRYTIGLGVDEVTVAAGEFKIPEDKLHLFDLDRYAVIHDHSLIGEGSYQKMLEFSKERAKEYPGNKYIVAKFVSEVSAEVPVVKVREL